MTGDGVEVNPRDLLSQSAIKDVRSIVPVAGGWDTALWRIERNDARSSALRVYSPGRQASWRTELSALAAAAKAGLPVPAVEVRGVWQDRHWLLLEWSPGTTVQEALFREPEQAGALGVAFGRTHARMHQIRIKPAIPGDAMLRGCFDGIEVWPELVDALGHELVVEDRLLHVDYHPLNVLTEDGAVSAVLDWANARRGDPRADVARTRSILRFARMLPDGGPNLRTILADFEAGWMRGYQEIAGRLAAMPLFDAWAAQFMVDDLSPKVGQPGVWLSEAQLAVLRRRAAAWSRRAKIAPLRRRVQP